MNKDDIAKHLKKSRNIAEHLLKVGKDETSVFISHEVVVLNDVAQLKTSIKLLPVRRLYKFGDKIVDDDYLTHEMVLEVES